MTWRGPRNPASTTARGYGRAHQQARADAAKLHRPEHLCPRCGKPLGPMGPNLHYDHNGQRTGYLGFSHAACNIRAGAQVGQRRQRTKIKTQAAAALDTSRRW